MCDLRRPPVPSSPTEVSGVPPARPRSPLAPPSSSTTFPVKTNVWGRGLPRQSPALKKPSNKPQTQAAARPHRGLNQLPQGRGSGDPASLGTRSVSRPEYSRWHAPKGMPSRPSGSGGALAPPPPRPTLDLHLGVKCPDLGGLQKPSQP